MNIDLGSGLWRLDYHPNESWVLYTERRFEVLQIRQRLVQWDMCNSMVTCWIHNNVSVTIKKSVLFITSASEVWKQLEKRF